MRAAALTPAGCLPKQKHARALSPPPQQPPATISSSADPLCTGWEAPLLGCGYSTPYVGQQLWMTGEGESYGHTDLPAIATLIA